MCGILKKHVSIQSKQWYNHMGYFSYNRKEKALRKKIVVLLMVAMVVTLAGCGSSGTKETKKAEEKSQHMNPSIRSTARR